MKSSVKNAILFSVFMIALIFSSCEKELYEDSIIEHSKTTSERISLNQLLTEIKNPSLKNYVNNDLRNKLATELGLNEMRSNSDAYFNFIKIVREGSYTTYTLRLNKYTAQKPYFLDFILTKEANFEKAGFIKYLPDNSTQLLDIKNYDGKILVYDVANNLKIEQQFINSQKISIAYVTNCYTAVTINTYNCTLGGDHPPGTTCDTGTPSNGYYEIFFNTYCQNEAVGIQIPEALMGSLDNETGGNGPNFYSINPNVMAFLLSLPQNMQDIVQNNPEIITYLEEEDASPDSKEFAQEMITQIENNPGVFTSITPFLIEKRIIDDPLDPCNKEVLNQLKSTSVNDICALISKLDNEPSVYNLIIKHEDFSPITPARAERYNPSNGSSPLRYTYIIKVNPNYDSSTKLFKASILIHEIIHAYLFSLIDDFQTGNNLASLDDFPALFQLLVNKNYPGSQADAHHHDMALTYVNLIAKTIQEYQTGVPVTNDSDIIELYKDLAWGGLRDAPVFDSTFPVGNPSRQRIINRYACEGLNQQVGTETPIGINCN